MTQKMLDSLITDAEYNIRYHQKKLIEAQATLAGLRQIIQEEVIITESQLND